MKRCIANFLERQFEIYMERVISLGYNMNPVWTGGMDYKPFRLPIKVYNYERLLVIQFSNQSTEKLKLNADYIKKGDTLIRILDTNNVMLMLIHENSGTIFYYCSNFCRSFGVLETKRNEELIIRALIACYHKEIYNGLYILNDAPVKMDELFHICYIDFELLLKSLIKSGFIQTTEKDFRRQYVVEGSSSAQMNEHNESIRIQCNKVNLPATSLTEPISMHFKSLTYSCSELNQLESLRSACKAYFNVKEDEGEDAEFYGRDKVHVSIFKEANLTKTILLNATEVLNHK